MESTPLGGRDRDRSPLSQREREIVVLVAQGFKNKEMAEKMFISEQTVKNHLHNIFDKLGVSDRLELALDYLLKERFDGGKRVERVMNEVVLLADVVEDAGVGSRDGPEGSRCERRVLERGQRQPM